MMGTESFGSEKIKDKSEQLAINNLYNATEYYSPPVLTKSGSVFIYRILYLKTSNSLNNSILCF